MDNPLFDWAWWATIVTPASPLVTIVIGFLVIDSWKGVWLSCVPGMIATLGWIAIIGIENWGSRESLSYGGIGFCLLLASIPAVWGVLAANAAAFGWMLRRRFLPRQRTT